MNSTNGGSTQGRQGPNKGRQGSKGRQGPNKGGGRQGNKGRQGPNKGGGRQGNNDRQGSKRGRQANSNKHRQNSRNNERTSEYKRPRHEKLEIKFDPEARREYLTTLSSKKKERRTFGLAMQKVKDRRARLEDRLESKKALLEQIEDAERSKRQAIYLEHDVVAGTGDKATEGQKEQKEESITTFQDQTTQSQFGGQVIVTTTFNLLSDDEDDEIPKDLAAASKKNVDMEQKYAGSVEKYISQLKNNLPSRRGKMKERAAGKRGKHGAEGMKGMGSAKDLKMAKKTLGRMRDKQGPVSGGKGKKGKGR